MSEAISCAYCLGLKDALHDQNERAENVYLVGNQAKPQMGHAMYFSHEGRTALCIAKMRGLDRGVAYHEKG